MGYVTSLLCPVSSVIYCSTYLLCLVGVYGRLPVSPFYHMIYTFRQLHKKGECARKVSSWYPVLNHSCLVPCTFVVTVHPLDLPYPRE